MNSIQRNTNNRVKARYGEANSVLKRTHIIFDMDASLK